MQSLMYISELTVTEFGGTDIAVYCNWSVNGGKFANSTIIQGTCVMFYNITRSPSLKLHDLKNFIPK